MAPLHIITENTSLLSSFIFSTAFTWLNVSVVFVTHRFQLEAYLDKGINRIVSVLKPKAATPRYIFWIKFFLCKLKTSNQLKTIQADQGKIRKCD